MGSEAKLYKCELKILELEEKKLRELISKYQIGLNALKVEELTILSKIGNNQDSVRKSGAVHKPNAKRLKMSSTDGVNPPNITSKVNTSSRIIKPQPRIEVIMDETGFVQ